MKHFNKDVHICPYLRLHTFLFLLENFSNKILKYFEIKLKSFYKNREIAWGGGGFTHNRALLNSELICDTTGFYFQIKLVDVDDSPIANEILQLLLNNKNVGNYTTNGNGTAQFCIDTSGILSPDISLRVSH